MRALCAVLTLSFGLVASAAQAIVLHDQPVGNWDAGWCSPCGGDLDNYSQRIFGSFDLSGNSTLQRGTFAIHDVSPGNDDLHVSIWDDPTGTELFSLVAPGGSYGIVVNPDAERYYAVVDLPNWTLAGGSYWVGIFGTNGNHLGWGTDFSPGNDASYDGNAILQENTLYVGFKLEGLVPEPGCLALALLAMTASCFVRCR